MKRDSRLSDVLHVLLHLAHHDGPVTSEVLAKAMRTHPVVLRRTMAGLRTKGYVRSEKGHGGGWELACDLSRVTLRDVYEALGKPTLFALGNRSHHPDCLVEKAVNSHLNNAFAEAGELLMVRFGEVTLAMLREAFEAGLSERGSTLDISIMHGGQK